MLKRHRKYEHLEREKANEFHKTALGHQSV